MRQIVTISPSLSLDTDLAGVAADAPVMHVGHSQVSTHVTVIHRLENWVKRKTSLKTSLHIQWRVSVITIDDESFGDKLFINYNL